MLFSKGVQCGLTNYRWVFLIVAVFVALASQARQQQSGKTPIVLIGAQGLSAEPTLR